jgi:V/A-type H+-transporting ATPase subunit A
MTDTTNTGKILDINGPIVTIRMPGVRSGAQVRIGNVGLYGEVIALKGDQAIVQAYESTDGICPGEPAEDLGWPLSVELGPGLMGQIFDGVQRPLENIFAQAGDRIPLGLNIVSLDREKQWHFVPSEECECEPGKEIKGGTVLGTVQETETVLHKVMIPPDIHGEVLEIAPQGDYRLDDCIARVKSKDGQVHKIKLYHRWAVRRPRPFASRDNGIAPLITGQRVLDTFFPILKGGKSAVPGPFGAGKTVVQQQIARWANADIVIYVGCGERGNELVDVLETFPEMTDPYTGRKLMERTLLVANTSNMPVVAREASVYVGMTMAEYYRDMGYDVVMLADSTSRWAEALREVSGRLGQMPVEEGYPAYLASRLAAIYERAGRINNLGGSKGSVTLIGAVSPPGGDFSEPVTSHTKDIIDTFWALSKELADARHYPSVDWVGSFSGHVDTAAIWWAKDINPAWKERRAAALGLLSRDAELSRIVNLVGPEALSSPQRWVLEGAALIKEAVLQQSAMDEIDTFCSPAKQFELLDLVLTIYDQGADMIERGVPIQELQELALLGQARRLKSSYKSEQLDKFTEFRGEIDKVFHAIGLEYAKQEHA